MISHDFILNKLNELANSICELSYKYEFKEFSDAHFVELSYKTQLGYTEVIEEFQKNLYIEFFDKYPFENLTFLSPIDDFPFENPIINYGQNNFKLDVVASYKMVYGINNIYGEKNRKIENNEISDYFKKHSYTFPDEFTTSFKKRNSLNFNSRAITTTLKYSKTPTSVSNYNLNKISTLIRPQCIQ